MDKRWAASRNSCLRSAYRIAAAASPTPCAHHSPHKQIPAPTLQDGTVDGGNTRCAAVLCAQCIGAGASYRCLLALLHPDPWQDGRRREHTSRDGFLLPEHQIVATAFHAQTNPRPRSGTERWAGKICFMRWGLTARASGRCRSASPGLPSGNSRRRRCWCGDRRRHRDSWRCSGSARRRCGR